MADESKNASRLVRQFKSVDGALTPRVTENAIGVVFTTPANQKSTEVSLADFCGGNLPPVGIGRMMLAYGANTTIGNALGNLDKTELDDPDEVMSALRDRIELLKAGKWASERVGGGRPSMVWQAFQEFRQSKGQKDDEVKLAALHAQWFDDDANNARLLANAEFAAFLASFKAKRKKPAEAAQSADLLA